MEFNLFKWNLSGISLSTGIQWNSTRHFLWGRIEVFVKIQKKNSGGGGSVGGSGWGVRVDVNEELKFL